MFLSLSFLQHLPLGPGKGVGWYAEVTVGSLSLAFFPLNLSHRGDNDTHPLACGVFSLGRRQETWDHYWLYEACVWSEPQFPHL